MTKDDAVLIGFFPKKTSHDTTSLKNPSVKEICSVSDCISQGPPDWINQWKHNTDWWLFDSEEAALSVISYEKGKYDLYAYKLFPFYFDGRKAVSIALKPLNQDLNNYDFLGFDIVSAHDTRAGADPAPSVEFGCSPLSCNGALDIYPVNQFCLIQDFDKALNCCKTIAEEIDGEKIVNNAWKGKWEPGPYYLVEVYRKKK